MIINQEDSLEAEARRWEEAAVRHDAEGKRGSANHARDQAAVLRAEVRERMARRQLARTAGVRFG